MNDIKKDSLEIERKWILRRNPFLEPDKSFLIYQIYAEDGWRYRYQIEIAEDKQSIGEKYFKTRKIPVSIGVNEEEEYEVSKNEYLSAIEMEIKSISKLREVYFRDGLKFEVDIFDDIALCILEVELSSIDQHFEMPEFLKELIIYEVTGITEFNNSSLARKSSDR